MARIYEALLLEEHNNALYQQSLQGEPRTPEIGISNPGFLEEEKPTVVTTKLGMLGIPEARDRRMSTASMISAISRRSHVPRGDAKDDKTALKSALKDTSALGRTKMGMQRWKEGNWFEVDYFPSGTWPERPSRSCDERRSSSNLPLLAEVTSLLVVRVSPLRRNKVGRSLRAG